MLIIGLTGNIGSGKSTVSEIFSRLGVPVWHADRESKKLYSRPEVVKSIRENFGNVFHADHSLNRKKMASIVFSDPAKLELLNSILHPLVRKDFRTWTTLQTHHPYVIQEAAILFESGFRNEFDRVIHVSCPPETAIARVVLRDGVDAGLVKQRARFQLDEKEKAALSDFIILNDGFHLVIPQVLSVHRQILEIAS